MIRETFIIIYWSCKSLNPIKYRNYNDMCYTEDKWLGYVILKYACIQEWEKYKNLEYKYLNRHIITTIT